MKEGRKPLKPQNIIDVKINVEPVWINADWKSALVYKH